MNGAGGGAGAANTDWTQAAAILLGVVTAVGLGVLVLRVEAVPTAPWKTIGLAAAILGLAVAVMFLARTALRQAPPPATTLQGDDAPMRARIAPTIISLGTAGIVGMAAVVLVLLYMASLQDVTANDDPNPLLVKLDTVLLGIFSTTLPVLATWVGTVLAFYFTNESFRTASESTQRLVGGRPLGDEPITSPTRMIPFEKMTRYDLPAAVPAGDEMLTAEQRAEKVKIEEFYGTFNATVTRLPILDADRRVLFIVRKKLLDIGYQPPAAPPAADAVVPPPPPSPKKPFVTVGDYLNFEQNRADARNFQFLHGGATVEGARQVMKIYDTLDIFITDHGKPHEPIKGWVTDDGLR